MSELTLAVKITGEGEGLKAEISGLTKALRSFGERGDASGKSVAKSMGNVADAIHKTTASEKLSAIKTSAFATLQVRSNAKIKHEIESVSRAYKRLAFRGAASTSELARASRSAQAKIAALNAELTNGFTKLGAAQTKHARKSSSLAALQIRSNHDIQREIDKVRAAYSRLAAGGSASAAELARASAAVKTRVAALNDELGISGGVAKKSMTDAQKAAAKLAKSYDTLGLRSMRTVQRETLKARAAYQRLKDSGKLTGRELARANAKMKQSIVALEKEARIAAPWMDRVFGGMKGLVGLFGAGAGIRALSNAADTYKNVNAQLITASRNTQELAIAQQGLQQIARDTRSNWEATVTVYARMARATQELGIPQQDLLTVTKALNQAVTVSGATSIEASNALIQLSQGMASGTLRGDELRSVLEQIPRVGQAIAKGMGISFGQLRQLGQDGKITTQQIISALKKQAGTLQTEFDKMPPTIGQAIGQINNSFTQWIGTQDKAIGLSSALSGVLLSIADNFNLVAKAAIAAAAAMIGFKTATLAANRGLLGLSKVLGGIGALLAGLVIGSYFREQFLIVRQVASFAISQLVTGFEILRFNVVKVVARISGAWDKMWVYLNNKMADFIRTSAEGLSKIDFLPGISSVSSRMKAYADSFVTPKANAEALRVTLKKLNNEHLRNLSIIESATNAQALADIQSGGGSTRQPANAGSTVSTAHPSSPIVSIGDPTKKLLSSADSFTGQLSNKYKSSFERIAEKYSVMFDKLEALGKPGEKKLEDLQTAYGQFVEQSWLKQEDKRKSILSKGVDAIAESLLSENERRKQALDNRVAMIQQAQDDGLISEQRGLELRNQLHADYDQQLADQKLQAMQASEQAATDLKAQFAQIASSNQLVNLESLRSNMSQHLNLITQKNEETGKKELSFTKATASQKLAFVSGSLKMLGGLMQSHNRKAFELGKAAAIADATVSTIVAVMKAWKDYGWPWGAVLGAGIAVAGAANVAKIASTKMGGGASAGGIAGGSGSAPSVTGGATNVVLLNPRTGIPQRPTTPVPTQSSAPIIQITQHITAPNSIAGSEAAIAQAADQVTRQAMATIQNDFANNLSLRQALAV